MEERASRFKPGLLERSEREGHGSQSGQTMQRDLRVGWPGRKADRSYMAHCDILGVNRGVNLRSEF